MQDMREQYINRMYEKRKKHRKYWLRRRTIDIGLQVVVIVGSASLPVLLNISELSKLVPTVLSILVAVSAGLLKYFKFDEWARIHRSTYFQLDNELEDYGLGTGRYKEIGKDETFHLFRHMTALILSKHARLLNDLHGHAPLAQQEDTHREEHAEA
jgi:Protein of unknown function (DUF4231)